MAASRSPKRFVTEGSRRVAAAREPVMEQLVEPARRSAWQSEILRFAGPRRLSAGDVAEGTAHMLGFRVEGKSAVLEASDGAYEEDVVVGVRLRVRYEVREGPSDVVLYQRLEAALPGGVSGWLLSLFLRRGLRKMQRRSLDGLAAQLEAAGSD